MAKPAAPAIVDLSIVRGDSFDITITVTDDAVPTQNPINLSQATDGTVGRPAVIRFAVKRDPSRDANSESAILKKSYRDDEVEILPQGVLATKGQCKVKGDKPDTTDNDAGEYLWDTEVTLQDAQRTGASGGTVALVADSVAVVGTGTAFLKAKVGDVIQVLSGANAGRPSLITAIASNGAMTTERAWESSDASATFEIRRGKSKTVVRGTFTLVQDVVL